MSEGGTRDLQPVAGSFDRRRFIKWASVGTVAAWAAHSVPGTAVAAPPAGRPPNLPALPPGVNPPPGATMSVLPCAPAETDWYGTPGTVIATFNPRVPGDIWVFDPEGA